MVEPCVIFKHISFTVNELESQMNIVGLEFHLIIVKLNDLPKLWLKLLKIHMFCLPDRADVITA